MMKKAPTPEAVARKRAAKMVRYYAERARETTLARDRMIVDMHQKGATLRAIAEAAGMSHMAIQKIVKRDA